MARVPSTSSAEQGSSIRITSGSVGIRRAMQSFCCCSSCRKVAGSFSRSLEVGPQSHLGQGLLHGFIELGFGELGPRAMDAQTEYDVLVHRERQRVRALEHHAHRFF